MSGRARRLYASLIRRGCGSPLMVAVVQVRPVRMAVGQLGVQELEEFAFNAPEFEDRFLGNVQRAQADDGLKEQEIGAGVVRAFEDREIKALLKPLQVDCGTVKRFGYVGEFVHHGM